ncbi:MAG: phosphoribosylanthranilate isomerase [Gemmatimonadota bacterium]|nr:MAG: phosphoribosylanthranilate isomerase [Gemmatimonadota bacterium]
MRSRRVPAVAEFRSGQPDADLATPPAVKICGVTRSRDALVAESLGAGYVGMILSGGFERSVTTEVATAITSSLDIKTVAVLVDEAVEAAVLVAETVGVDVLQLHGSEPEGVVAELRSAGDWLVWKALRLKEPHDLERGLQRYGASVDGLLLEGWHPSKVGGSGVALAWEEFAAARDGFPEGVVLIVAGGLTPGNVRDAVSLLCPDVVDTSSGVEFAVGIKDPGLVQAFVKNARGERG